MFVADCQAALSLTLAASFWADRLWESQGPDRWAGSLTLDLAHWAESGVETAADLAALLRAESEREARKADLWPVMTAAEMAEEEAYYRGLDAAYEAEREAEAAAAAEDALWRVWDYDVTHGGRVLLAA